MRAGSTQNRTISIVSYVFIVLLLLIGGLLWRKEVRTEAPRKQQPAEQELPARTMMPWLEFQPPPGYYDSLTIPPPSGYSSWEHWVEYQQWAIYHPEELEAQRKAEEEARENAERARLQTLKRAKESLYARYDSWARANIIGEIGSRYRAWDPEDSYRTAKQRQEEDEKHLEQWRMRREAVRIKYGLTSAEMEVLARPWQYP